MLLTTYYGRLPIKKNLYQRNNPSIWLAKKLASSEHITSLILTQSSIMDKDLPKIYTLFSNEIGSFVKDGIRFDFKYKSRVKGIQLSIAKELVKIES